MEISIKQNLDAVGRKLNLLGKQATFATAVAMTKTAQDVRTALRAEMVKVFDAPTRYTLNSLRVSPATKSKLNARVFVKDSERPRHYLHPQIDGGRRPLKRFEELLMQRGLIAASERLVPGAGAQLDAHGNMGRGQIVKILSQLKAFNLAGFDANATNSKRSRAKRAKQSYFFARGKESRVGARAWRSGDKVQHLPTAVYAKTADGISPVLVVVKSAAYRQLLRFHEVGQRVVADRFDRHFAEQFQIAMRTARWSR